MIVVDASVVTAAISEPGRLGDAATRSMRGEELAAPSVLDLEVAHAVRGRLLGGKLSSAAASVALAQLAVMRIKRVHHTGLLARVWELRQNYTAYDAAYVALAEQLSTRLLTGDARLAHAVGARCDVDLII